MMVGVKPLYKACMPPSCNRRYKMVPKGINKSSHISLSLALSLSSLSLSLSLFSLSLSLLYICIKPELLPHPQSAWQCEKFLGNILRSPANCARQANISGAFSLHWALWQPRQKNLAMLVRVGIPVQFFVRSSCPSFANRPMIAYTFTKNMTFAKIKRSPIHHDAKFA